MKKSYLILLLIITLSHFSCEDSNETIPEFSIETADQMQTDEYEIYSVILESFSISQFIIRQQTTSYTPPQENLEVFFSLDKLSGMDSTLYSQYVNANSSTYLLDEQIAVSGKGVKIISNKELAYFFDRENLYNSWALFEKKYPEAGKWYFYFNKIGFNENYTQAIVGIESYWFMESPDGPTLKSGRLIYLEKVNEVWEFLVSTSYNL
ncbi:hypothetical protein [Chondrinema litorale]|uniref:hypothetical protein n=1 Tax=Chondrinema litorale TaxID=2994555 RepID=UPI002542DD2B|nr:hypothetical protein [Chondrinema litorale]UZR96413.1 hypothetical protein OQ292_22410 [Chondrinema litorale]